MSSNEDLKDTIKNMGKSFKANKKLINLAKSLQPSESVLKVLEENHKAFKGLMDNETLVKINTSKGLESIYNW